MSPRRLYDVLSLRLRSLFRRASVERDLARELASHLEQQVQENIGKGMLPDAARAAAMRALGGLAQIEEECRDMRRTNRIETVWSDLRYAIRVLRRAPGFTVTIVLTLALSIGATSAIFSLVEGVLLRPLPYPNPDRLMRIYFQSVHQPKFPLNPNDFHDFREHNRTFESIAAISRHDVQLSGFGAPVRLSAFAVTAGYFKLLGTAPARGREFAKEDELPGHNRSAILSDRLWRARFASDPGIVGRSVKLDSQPYTVTGVMPPGAQHPGNNFHAVADGETVDLWIPFSFGDPKDRGSHYMDGFGRLKPGVSPQQANADLSAVLSQIQVAHPSMWRVYAVPLYQETVGSSQRMLTILLAAVGLLLLIACVNAANLMLARATSRAREIAIRAAIGAARWRIVRQLLTESLTIALAGGVLGTALAFGGVRLLVAFLPEGFPRATAIRLDLGVYAFTLVTAILTGLLFGLVPALVAAHADPQQSLRDGGRGTTGGARQMRLRNLLIVGETGLACVLLIAAGLLLHSFVNLLRSDPGFRPRQVLTASVILPYEGNYRSEETRIRFVEHLMAALQSLPGVEAAGVGSDLPWTGYDGNADGFSVEGRDASYSEKTTARYHGASPGYFRALGIPLLHGRFFDGRDDQKSPAVMVVNEAMARGYWPGEDAIGKRISFSGHPAEKDWIRIVGIVRDVRDRPESDAVRPAFWFPYTQEPENGMSIAIRSRMNAALIAKQLRSAVARLDPELAVADVTPMPRIVAEAVSVQRFALFLVSLFAVLALALAAIGMYGVISYSVNQRTPEFGLRIALGAATLDLMRLILGQSIRLAVAGTAIGLICAAASARILEGLLYGVAGVDPATYVGVAALALATALLAGYFPARRATNSDPMSSLRAG